MFEQSRETEILKSIIDDTEYNKTPQSRNEEILVSILNDTEYTKTPQSREEELLLQLKDVIEDGKVIKHVSGNQIEFDDGADAPLVKCKSEVQGSQDLHGYDKPWVGGAGKNKIDLIDASLESGSVVISNGTIKINGSFSNKLVNLSSYVNLAYLNDAVINQQITYSITMINGEFNASGIFFSAQDSTYYIQMPSSTGKVTATPTKELTVFRLFLNGDYDCEFKLQIEFGSSATSWTPYSNICPITAYTEGEIEVRGHNLWDEEVRNGYYNSITGAYVSYSNCIANVNPIRVMPNTQYYSVSGSYTLIGYFYDADMGFITQTQINTGIFTTPNNCHYLNICNSYGQGGTYNNDISINYPSTATTYEPYTSTLHTTTFPSAIYRGSEDVVNGSVECKNPVKTITSDMTINTYTFNGMLGVEIINGMDSNYERVSGICSHAVVATSAGAQITHIGDLWLGVYSKNIYWIGILDLLGISTIADFKTWLSNNTVQYSYELATPTTSSVTPTNLPIKSLSGYNHISSTTGDMEIEYIKKDYQKFVDTVEKALPNTRKGGGIKAIDIFKSLVIDDEKEFVK